MQAKQLLAVALIIVVFASVSSITYLLNRPNSPKTTETSISTTTQVVVALKTTVATSIVTRTFIEGTGGNSEALSANLPKTCLNTYPNGLNLNSTNYFIISNQTTTFAQICIKYTFNPQNVTGPAMSLLANGTYNALFNNSRMYMLTSFGNEAQYSPISDDIVIPDPSSLVFNASGESLVVVYTFEWSLAFSYFSPANTDCSSILNAIGIAESSGPGSSGLSFPCPASPAGLLTYQLVGSSYLKLATE